jgi:hypothetical protein
MPHSDINALVVEAEINDQPGPYMVKLTRTVSFSSSDQVVVRKAEVYVTDELNNRYDFKEKKAGLYFSDSAAFRGKTGVTYTLFINTDDNLNYKSTPCNISKPSKLDSVRFSSKSEYSFQVNGDISFDQDQDIMIKIDASVAIGNSIDSLFVFRSPPPSTSTHIIHKIKTRYSSANYLNYLPVLKANTDYINGSKIKNIPLFPFTVLPAKIDIAKDKKDSISFNSGSRFILIINASTVSNESFSYFNSMINQMSENNVFFEPTPTQLIGNITCINDKSKSVYGLFQANAITRKYYKYIEWYNRFKELSAIPALDIESIDSTVTSDGGLFVIYE